MILDRIPSTVWALLCAALIAGAGVQRGEASKARADLSDYRREVADATARSDREARDKETALRGEAEQLKTALTNELDHAKTRQDRLIAGIRAGTQRLSIAASCPAAGQTASDPAFAAGTGPEGARAELDRTVAEALVAIAADGDTAIRERNACIALYDATRATLNQD